MGGGGGGDWMAVFEGNNRNHKIEIIKSKRVSVERQSRILHNKYEH